MIRLYFKVPLLLLSFFFFFHHTTCEGTCDTLASSAANQGDNTVSVDRLELPKLCYHPGWRLMRLGYRTCLHTYDEKKKNDNNNNPWELSTPELADGYPLKPKWQQVSSNLLDFSQYSGWSQQCISLDSLHLFCYFLVLESLY